MMTNIYLSVKQILGTYSRKLVYKKVSLKFKVHHSSESPYANQVSTFLCNTNCVFHPSLPIIAYQK